MKFGIRAATTIDRDWLEAAYLGMLRFLDSQDFNILPTAANATFMADEVFTPAIIDGRGVFIATDEKGNPVAALFWVVDESELDTRFRTATSFGQWVEEPFRGQGLVPFMAEHVSRFLKENGVQQIFDMVHTDEAREASEKCGFSAHTNIVTLNL